MKFCPRQIINVYKNMFERSIHLKFKTWRWWRENYSLISGIFKPAPIRTSQNYPKEESTIYIISNIKFFIERKESENYVGTSKSFRTFLSVGYW